MLRAGVCRDPEYREGGSWGRGRAPLDWDPALPLPATGAPQLASGSARISISLAGTQLQPLSKKRPKDACKDYLAAEAVPVGRGSPPF